MPTTEPMTSGEIARLFERLSTQWSQTDTKLDAIRTQLNDKPGLGAFAEFKQDQATIHTNLERRIDEVDARQTNNRKDMRDELEKDISVEAARITTLETRSDRNLWGIVLVALGAAVNLIVNVSGG